MASFFGRQPQPLARPVPVDEEHETRAEEREESLEPSRARGA